MITLPEDFVITKFYQFAGGPTRNRYNNTYQGSCPMCREGNSWLKKKRFYFIPEKNLIYCHNCGYKCNPLKWISDVSCVPFYEVLKEANSSFSDIIIDEPEKEIKKESDTLPKDCINLFDENQLNYYRNNEIVKLAKRFLETRMLTNAVNIPKAFYISLTDKVHKNRIIIPFFDENGKIIYYQSRTLLKSDEASKPRYLSKINSEKSLFNIDKIDNLEDTIYIFEGPINSCFVKNGIAIGGIQENSYQLFTPKQQEQIDKFPFHKKIWILDSQWKDKASFNKTKKLLELKESVFLWPEKIGTKFKDFNDIAIYLKQSQISTDFVKKYTKSI